MTKNATVVARGLLAVVTLLGGMAAVAPAAAATPAAVPGGIPGLVPGDAVPVTVATGFSHTCAIDAGALWCWGENWAGQLGDGSTTRRTTPVRVGDATTWTTVVAAGDHTCALRGDDSLWCWGENWFGQLGDGTTTNRPVPTRIGDTTTWATVTTNGDHTCAVRPDATLWCWGYNENGQLGDGTTTNRPVPTRIGDTTTWATAAAGSVHTCALRADATLWCWGNNKSGQLGDGTTTNRPVPAQVGEATSWTASTAGGVYACGLRADATLWCWGGNQHGQLGDATRSTRTTPVPVSGGASWARVAAGGGHACGLQSAGSLWCWGWNRDGQLGDGTTTDRTAPVRIGEATWTTVSTGASHTCAVQTGGTLWCWGENWASQLGDGTTTSRQTPVRVALPRDLSVPSATASDHDDQADRVWDPATVVPVPLAQPRATPPGVKVSPATNVITIMSVGTYQLTGSIPDGRIVIDTPDEGTVRLILDNADITSKNGPPIQVVQADELLIFLADKSKNTLSDYVADPQPAPMASKKTAVVSSTADLTIAGPGSLTVNSRDNDGIVSDDGLVINAAVTVNAGKDGIRGRDYVAIKGGFVAVTAGERGIAATNSTNPLLGYVSLAPVFALVTSGGTGIEAASDLLVENGWITITSGGGSAVTVTDEATATGMHAGAALIVHAGQITVDSAGSCLYSLGSASVSGGALSLKASVGSEADGVHSEGALDVLAGAITVTSGYEGLEALRLTISGGVVSVSVSDDGLNASEPGLDDTVLSPNAFIIIGGGTITVNAGDDGVDSNGSITITGGTTVVTATFDGVDTNGTILLAGGVVVVNGAPKNDEYEDGIGAGTGLVLSGGTLLSAALSASATPPAVSSPQGWVSLKLDTLQPAGTIIQLVSGTNVIAAYQSSRAFQSVLFTSNKLTNEMPYDVYLGGGVAGTGVGGMYPSGDLTGATKATTIVSGHFVATTKPRY